MIAYSLIALTLLLAGGVGLALLLLPRRDCFIPELAGLAVPLGSGVVSAAWFALSFAVNGSSLRWAVTAICVGLLVMGFWRFFRLGIPLRWGCGWVVPAIWTAQLAVITWQCLGRPLTADGLFIWEFKAKVAFLHGGVIPASYFGLPWRDLHPTYPLCIPLMDTWIYAWIGESHQGALKLLCPLFFVAGVGLLWGAGWRTTGNARKAAVASTLLFFVPWAMFKPGGAVSGWADFPLAIGYLALLTFALEAARTAPESISFASVRPLIACLALLPWMKQEGLILAGSTVAGLGLVWNSGTARRRALVVTGGLVTVPVTIALAWHWYLAVRQAAPNADFSGLSIETLAENAHRGIAIGILLLRELSTFDRWGLLWPVALLALADVRRRYPRETLVLAIALMLPGAVFAGSYIFSAWPNFVAHVNTSFSRLLIPLAMPALIAIGLALPEGIGGQQSK